MIKALASYKIQESAFSHNPPELTCDICESMDIIESREGYVCRECGVVLEIQKLQYDRPYNEIKIQYEKGVGITQIGTRRERAISPLSIKLQRINKYNSILDNELAVFEKARIEASRIFNALDLAGYDAEKEMVLTKFREIRPKLQPGTKYRSTEKLVAIIIHFCLKLRNVPVNPYYLVEVSKLTKKEFNDFLLQIQKYIPRYAERDRKEYILQRLFEISEHLELGTDFYFLGGRILNKLWNGVKNTTDNALAALISSISLICSGSEKVSVSAICTRFGVRMSTVQTQVRSKIFERFHVKGFVSLIKSSDILVKIMEKLGLLEGKELEEEVFEVVESDDHVEMVLGNVVETFNSHNTLEYYYFAVRGENRTPVIITFRKPEKLRLKTQLKLIFNRRIKELKRRREGIPEFGMYHYYSAKDPPPIAET